MVAPRVMKHEGKLAGATASSCSLVRFWHSWFLSHTAPGGQPNQDDTNIAYVMLYEPGHSACTVLDMLSLNITTLSQARHRQACFFIELSLQFQHTIDNAVISSHQTHGATAQGYLVPFQYPQGLLIFSPLVPGKERCWNLVLRPVFKLNWAVSSLKCFQSSAYGGAMCMLLHQGTSTSCIALQTIDITGAALPDSGPFNPWHL